MDLSYPGGPYHGQQRIAVKNFNAYWKVKYIEKKNTSVRTNINYKQYETIIISFYFLSKIQYENQNPNQK